MDSLKQALERYYVFPELVDGMAQRLDSALVAPPLDTLSSPAGFARQLTQILRSAHPDAHLRTVFDPEEAARALNPTKEKPPGASDRDRRMNFSFEQARILPGNIGLVAFTQFADTSAEARSTIQAAMRFVANSDGLILDLRENRGGSAAMAAEITSYFVRDREHWWDTYNRATDRWTETWTTNRPEVTGGLYLDMPLAILTSPWTFSAAEGLAYTLKYGRGAQVVGQATAGGAHVIRRVPLGSGYIGFIPYIRSANVVTKTDWEGTGVAPDLEVAAPDALLRAHQNLLEGLLPAGADSSAARATQFAIRQMRAQTRPTCVPPGELEECVGQFEEYTFFLRDGRLWSRNKIRNEKLDELVAIDHQFFMIDRESQAEFVRDANGLVSRMLLYWSDGWVDIVKRSE